MKLIKILVLFIIFSIFIVHYSFGYSTQYLDFDVPKGYEVTSDIDENDNIYYSIEKNNEINNLYIIVMKHNEPAFLNFKYNEENLDSIINGFFGGLNNENYKDYNVVIEKKGTSVIGTKPYSCFDMLCKISKYNLYQRYYICVTDNYAYGFVLTSEDTDFFYSTEAFTVLNSIKIRDTITTDDNYSYSEKSDKKSWFERGIDGALERCSNWRHCYTCLCNLFSNNQKKEIKKKINIYKVKALTEM